MDRQALTSLADQLRRQRETILAEVAAAEDDLQRIAEGREIELEERASEEVVARLLERLDDRGRREVEEIDAALERISAGSYGTCTRCAEPIALPRLQALPATRLCIACARATEIGRPRG